MESKDTPLRPNPGRTATTPTPTPQTAPGAEAGATQQMREKADEMRDNVAQSARTAKQHAEDLASTAGKSAEDVAHRVGEQVESLADTVRGKGPSGKATEIVADAMEGAGQYLQDADFQDMGQDLTNVIRRYPVQSVLVGIGIGYLLARTTER